MSDLKARPAPAWERFFEYLYPCDKEATRAEVREDLSRLGIDVRKAVDRVQKALAAAKGKAMLAEARTQRLSAVARLGQVVPSAPTGLRERLRGLIEGKFQGTERAAYFHKLEAAATDADLESLLTDIHRLEALSEGTPGDTQPTE
ncbi:MAG: hypothetical protein C0467_29675 [Planctomycetaceae bacterium]|nr:hypothetical protein [Planctomycetaceae bacterium]